MIIIPAIDIRKGKCVRLTKGKIDHETIYSPDPVFIAKLWQINGAKRLHVVDLDGAFSGAIKNMELLKQIREAVHITIEFGGGVRSMEFIKHLIEIGIDKIILGTVLVYNPELARKAIKKYKNRIMAAIDISSDKIAIAGWKEKIASTPKEFIKKVESMGIKEIIVTDTEKDGTLEGVNIELIKNTVEGLKIKTYVSGGISSVNDLENIKKLKLPNVAGVIIGKAFYNESIKFEDAQKVFETNEAGGENEAAKNKI